MRKDTSRCSFIFECRNTSSRQSSRHARDVYLKGEASRFGERLGKLLNVHKNP